MDDLFAISLEQNSWYEMIRCLGAVYILKGILTHLLCVLCAYYVPNVFLTVGGAFEHTMIILFLHLHAKAKKQINQ